MAPIWTQFGAIATFRGTQFVVTDTFRGTQCGAIATSRGTQCGAVDVFSGKSRKSFKAVLGDLKLKENFLGILNLIFLLSMIISFI